MMKIQSCILIFILSFMSPVFAECVLPGAPIVPDGNVASEDEIRAAIKEFKRYQGALADYRDCLLKIEQSLDPDSEEDAVRASQLMKQHNASVDTEVQASEFINQSIRDFKKRQQ